MSVTIEQLEAALAPIADPCIAGKTLAERQVFKDLAVNEGLVSLRVSLGYPAAGIADEIKHTIRDALMGVAGVNGVDVLLDWAIVANKNQNDKQSMNNVKNIIAIASGKGGVGKSTTAVNVALALAAEGAKVGLLDADIYGPSQPIMLGIPEHVNPKQVDGKYFEPIRVHGLQTMSMGYLVTDKTPMVWRGPMVSGALQQMLNQTLWSSLDYLIIDMPPGTGDIQLTLSQQVPVTGSAIVTTPQDIALLDATKGIEMFRKVNIPVLGIIENMALHICSSCGHVEHIFGEGGGQKIAAEYDAPLLGSLPLDLSIRQQADSGQPTVIAQPDGEIAQAYRGIARQMAAALAARGRSAAFPEIIMRAD